VETSLILPADSLALRQFNSAIQSTNNSKTL
jgi:hypothetical protein